LAGPTTDIGAALFLLLQGLEIKRGSVCSNAVEYVAVIAVAINLYFLARCVSKEPLLRGTLISVIGCLTIFISCANLFFELGKIRFFMAHGWSAMDGLRAYLPAIGAVARNDSLTLLLTLFIFVCASSLLAPRSMEWRVGVLFVEVCALSALLLGFESGIYLGIALFAFLTVLFAVLCLRQVGTTVVIQQLGVCVLALVVVLAFGQMKAVWRTGVPFGNAMHTRSATGRVVVWHRAVVFIAEHPVMGVGGYCAPRTMLATKGDFPHRPFTAHSYDGFLEVLEQNGFAGLAFYALWLLGAIWQGISTVRNQKAPTPDRTMIAILTSGVISLLCTDMFYGAIPHAWGPMWAFGCMVGLIASPVERVVPGHEGL
jgi:O-antigen ligase